MTINKLRNIKKYTTTGPRREQIVMNGNRAYTDDEWSPTEPMKFKALRFVEERCVHWTYNHNMYKTYQRKNQIQHPK